MIYRETLNLLEWERLGEHLATFTATKMGAIAARNLPIPTSLADSKELLAQTQEIYGLEQNLERTVKYCHYFSRNATLKTHYR